MATLPPGAKNDRNIIFLPVIFLSIFLINHRLEAGQYLPLQSVHFAFLFLQNGTLHRLFSFQKVVPYTPFAEPETKIQPPLNVPTASKYVYLIIPTTNKITAARKKINDFSKVAVKSFSGLFIK